METEYSLLIVLQSKLSVISFAVELFETAEYLKKILFYIFDRRFGWSEGEILEALQKNILDANSLKLKKLINDTLDEFIFFLKSQSLSAPILAAYLELVQTTNKPVVRQQTFRNFFDWLRNRMYQDTELPKVTKYFEQIKVPLHMTYQK